MELFRMAGKSLMVGGLLVFLYDLISSWFIDASPDIRSLAEWWRSFDAASLSNAKSFLSAHMKSAHVEKLFKAPGAFIVFAPGLFFYFFYRVIFALKGGKSGGGGGFKYRSRD